MKFFKNFYYILVLIIILWAIFLLVPNVQAANPSVICQKTASGIEITIKIAFYQNNLTGGDAKLKNDLIPKFKTHIEEVWNKVPTTNVNSCKIPVKFTVDAQLAPGGATVYPVGADASKDTKDNGAICLTKHPGYNCIKTTDEQIIFGTGGWITISAYDVMSQTVIDPNFGWWEAYYDTNHCDRPCCETSPKSCATPEENADCKCYGGPDSRTPAHETGHLLGLDDEYFKSARSSNLNIMGNNDKYTDSLQKHVDTIVQFVCLDTDLVCSDPPLWDREKCCPSPTNAITGTDFDTPNSATCKLEDVNECPGNTCGVAGTCDKTNNCTCTGDTCETACRPDACDPNTEQPGTGTCSDATNKYCCIPKVERIIGGGGGWTGSGSGTAGCEGISCISCIKTGNCTICHLIDVAYEIGKFIMAIVGAVTLLFFIYGAFLILLSAGIGERIDQGKRIIINSIIGLVIVFAAYLLVTTAVWLVTGQTQVFGSSLRCAAITAPSSPTGSSPGSAPAGGP